MASSRNGSKRSSKASSQSAHGTSIAGSSRPFFIIVFFILLALVFLGRLVYLQIIVADEYSANAQASRTVGFSVEAHRGTIYDRNGNILAISVDATTIYANPSEIDDPMSIGGAVASVLGGKAVDYAEAIENGTNTFAFLARKADKEKAAQLEALNLPGVYFIDDTRREYPYGECAGQVVGACSIAIDDETGSEYYVGISGLEYYYDEELSGQSGYYEAEVGADGMPIPGGVHESQAAVDGQDIIISIDIEMQQILETSLKSGLEKMGVESGSSIMVDSSTGEILAAASLPYFNPADRSEVKEGATQLKCISNLLEPGSIFKTVTALTALQNNVMQTDDSIDCPAIIEADGYQISDAHERGDTTYTLREIMQYSSNVGISLVAEKMGFDKLYNAIMTYKLHELTQVDYPGEQLGYLVDFDYWSRVVGYNVSFGQGVSVTPIQLVRFYGALLNNGYESSPHFLVRYAQSGYTPTYDMVEVIENKNAIAPMVSMLQSVVTSGTGTKAQIEGYDIAGKTSTAEIYDEENGGYLENRYNLGFLGFVANSNSSIVCYVGADNVAYDGAVTQIFQDIMTQAIDRYNIAAK